MLRSYLNIEWQLVSQNKVTSLENKTILKNAIPTKLQPLKIVTNDGPSIIFFTQHAEVRRGG